jgi:hypothetical protein
MNNRDSISVTVKEPSLLHHVVTGCLIYPPSRCVLTTSPPLWQSVSVKRIHFDFPSNLTASCCIPLRGVVLWREVSLTLLGQKEKTNKEAVLQGDRIPT